MGNGGGKKVLKKKVGNDPERDPALPPGHEKGYLQREGGLQKL